VIRDSVINRIETYTELVRKLCSYTVEQKLATADVQFVFHESPDSETGPFINRTSFFADGLLIPAMVEEPNWPLTLAYTNADRDHSR